jgi:uncharacterized protein
VVVSSYITPKAHKGASSAIEGRGLLAIAPIAAHELVAIKGGHVITTTALRSLPERLQNSEIQIAGGFHLAAVEEAEYEPVMLFLNHSCEPSVGFAGNVVLIAMRDISPGEELTTDDALFRRLRRRDGMPMLNALVPWCDRWPGLGAPRPAAQVRQLLLLLPPAPDGPPARP